MQKLKSVRKIPRGVSDGTPIEHDSIPIQGRTLSHVILDIGIVLQLEINILCRGLLQNCNESDFPF